MSKQIEIVGTVEKVVRMNEKAEAQMVILIPVSVSSTVPMGKVHITIQAAQSDMFADDEDDAPAPKKAVRGNKG